MQGVAEGVVNTPHCSDAGKGLGCWVVPPTGWGGSNHQADPSCHTHLQHHCRACGQIFCGKCSSKYSTIPKFGIEKEVRVCEPCYEHLNKSVLGVGCRVDLGTGLWLLP